MFHAPTSLDIATARVPRNYSTNMNHAPTNNIPHAPGNTALRLLASLLYLYPIGKFGIGSIRYLVKGQVNPALVMILASVAALLVSLALIWTGNRKLTLASFIPLAAYFVLTTVALPALPLPSIGAAAGACLVVWLLLRKQEQDFG